MIILILTVLGLCFGSFVNALVWRLHEQSRPKKKRAAKDSDLSILKGRSMCPDCQHTLSVKDLLPVISWLSLGGKCRYCHKPISWQYPTVELIAAGLFVFSYAMWPVNLSNNLRYDLQFVVWLAAIVIGIALAVYDFKWMLLPNKLVAILAACGLVFAGSFLLSSTSDWTCLGVLLSILGSGGIFWVLFQVSGGKWIGGGDVKLGLVLGLFLGSLSSALLMIFTASLVGSLYTLVLIIARRYKKGAHIPFGPFLLLATYLVFLLGHVIQNYYSKAVLL